MKCRRCGQELPTLSRCAGTHIHYVPNYEPHTLSKCDEALLPQLEAGRVAAEERAVYERILLACGLLPRAQTVVKEEREMRAREAVK